MAFDVQKALADGHSLSEINDYLGKQSGFNVAAARADGHSEADMLRHVMQKQADTRSLHEGRLAAAEQGLAAEQSANAPLTATEKLGVGADLATAALSKTLVGGVGGGAAGLLARATGQDPDEWKRWVDENTVYHPQSHAGQVIADEFGKAAGTMAAPLGGAISAADDAVGDYAGKGVQRALRQTLGTATDVASVLPGVAAVSEAATLARTLKAAKEAKLATTPLEIAQASGHMMLPSTVSMGTAVGDKPSALARAAERIGNPQKAERSFVRADLTNSNDLLAQGVGLKPKTILDDAAIDEAKKPAAAVYNSIRKYVPPSKLSDDVKNKILAAGRGTDSKLELPANVTALKEKLASGQDTWTSNELLDTMSDLRNKATKDLMSNDSEVVARGNAQMDIAHALEDHLTTQLNDNRFLVSPEEFRGARTLFAKIYTLDNARYGNDVNPVDIAKYGRETRLAKGKSANTGEFAIVESNATHSPHESAGKVPRDTSGSGNPLSAIYQGAAEVVRAPARSLLRRTRGITKNVPARENPALANFFQDERPPGRPELKLQPSPGPVVEPHQPDLSELGDMSSPMAESTQNPRTALTLKPPPGKVGMTPRQGVMDLGQSDDYLATALPTVDEIIRKLRGE